MKHLSEVAHILRAALNDNRDSVHAYAELLITKLHEDGEDRQANILHTVLFPSLEDVGRRIVPSAADRPRCECTGQGSVYSSGCPVHDKCGGAR